MTPAAHWREIRRLAELLVDFEGASIDEEHVRRWLAQFRPEERGPVGRALLPCLRHGYFSRARVAAFTRRLAGADLDGRLGRDRYWRSAELLEMGPAADPSKHSQEVLVDLLRPLVGDHDGRPAEPERFVFYDDFLLSGTHLVRVLPRILDRQRRGRLAVDFVHLAVCTRGLGRAKAALRAAADEGGIDVRARWCHGLRIENRVAPGVRLDVLSFPPPDGAGGRAAADGPAANRAAADRNAADRAVMVEAFHRTGREILASLGTRASCARPLGFGVFPESGFGVVAATHRSTPNHCPLAIWCGSVPRKPALADWYPLLPRSEAQQEAELEYLDTPGYLETVPSWDDVASTELPAQASSGE